MPPSAEGFATRLVLGPALRTQPDRRLVTLVREGYETAFEEIVHRYGKPLTRYAASIVGGRSEDVTQDAFSKALLALRRDGAEIELRPWLFRIVRNTALNDLRDSPPSPEILAEAIAGGRNPVEELERREEIADLMQRLQALPEPQRAAIVMRELEGLGHEEIAAALGLSGGGARQAIYRARQALRSGAGMLVPLPLLRAMLEGGGPGTAEAAAGAAGVGGAGVAFKATAATVLVAGAVGAGVAIDHGTPVGKADATPPPIRRDSGSSAAAVPPLGQASSAEVRFADRSRGDSSHGERKRGGDRSRASGDRGGSGPVGGNSPPGLSHSGSSGRGDSGPGKGSDGGDHGSGSGSGERSGHGGDLGHGGAGSGGEGSIQGDSESVEGSNPHAGPGPGDGVTEENLTGEGDFSGSGSSGSSGGGDAAESHSGDSNPSDLLRDSHSRDGLTE